MQRDALWLASPRHIYRALDNVPTRNASAPDRRLSGRVGRSADAPDGLTSHERDKSGSPTPSEIDALEESFCDFGLEPSQAEGDSSQSSYSDLQTTTTVTSLSSKTTSTLPGHLDLLQPLSGLTCDSGANAVMSLGDRLRLVWRMSPTSFSSHV